MTCDLTMRSDSRLARFSMHRCRGPRPALQSRTQACRERGLEAGLNTGFVRGTAEHTGSSALTTGCAGWHGVGSYRQAGARSTWEFPTTDMGWVPLHAHNPRTSLRHQWSRLLPGRALPDLAAPSSPSGTCGLSHPAGDREVLYNKYGGNTDLGFGLHTVGSQLACGQTPGRAARSCWCLRAVVSSTGVSFVQKHICTRVRGWEAAAPTTGSQDSGTEAANWPSQRHF